MRNFMIRAFEAVILAFSLLAALGVTLAAAGMVVGLGAVIPKPHAKHWRQRGQAKMMAHGPA